jgi:hypothetical protein
MTDAKVVYSNQIDLDQFFHAVREQIYVVIKLGDFPNYYKGSDIDVFCYNKDTFAKTILGVGNEYLGRGFEILVSNRGYGHTHVDFFQKGELEFRFDLHQSLPEYKRVKIKKHYIFSVIENAQTINREYQDETYFLYVPSPIDELMLRYIEYIEWYETRPDKVKHIDFILKDISGDQDRIKFIDKLHLYTELPETSSSTRKILHRFYVFRWIAHWTKRIQAVSLSRLPGAFFRRGYRVIAILLERLGLASGSDQ